MNPIPSVKSNWTPSLKWLPQWIETLPPEYSEPDPLDVSFSDLTIQSPIQRGLIVEKPILRQTTPRKGFSLALDKQINQLLFGLDSVSTGSNLGESFELPQILYSTDTELPKTVELLTDQGYVTLPRITDIFEFLFGGYTGWYWDGSLYLGGIGIKKSSVVNQTLPETSRDNLSAIWLEQANQDYLLVHPTRIKQNTVRQDTDFFRHHVRGTYPDQTIKIDGLIQSLTSLPITLDQYYSLTFAMADLGRVLSTTIPLHKKFVSDQSKNSFRSALALSLNTYSISEVENEGVISGIIDRVRYILRLANLNTSEKRIDTASPIDWRSDPLTSISISGNQYNKEIKNMVILHDSIRGGVNRGPKCTVLTTSVQTINLKTTLSEQKWNGYPNSFNIAPGVFE